MIFVPKQKSKIVTISPAFTIVFSPKYFPVKPIFLYFLYMRMRYECHKFATNNLFFVAVELCSILLRISKRKQSFDVKLMSKFALHSHL